MIASLLIALAANGGGSAPPPAPPPALAAELQPLSFLVGSCWRGTFPNSRRTDTHCFTPMLGGRFVRDVHVVEGAARPYSGESVYRWDAAAGHIRFDYFDSSGGHSAGIATPTEAGLAFPEEAHATASGQRMTFRGTWLRDGPDAFLFLNEEQRDGAWRELWRMRMERVGPAG